MHYHHGYKTSYASPKKSQISPLSGRFLPVAMILPSNMQVTSMQLAMYTLVCNSLHKHSQSSMQPAMIHFSPNLEDARLLLLSAIRICWSSEVSAYVHRRLPKSAVTEPRLLQWTSGAARLNQRVHSHPNHLHVAVHARGGAA